MGRCYQGGAVPVCLRNNWFSASRRKIPSSDFASTLRETLNKCSFSTTSKDKVAPDEISKSTEDTGDDDGIRAVYEEDAACNLFRRDGAGGAVGKVVRLD